MKQNQIDHVVMPRAAAPVTEPAFSRPLPSRATRTPPPRSRASSRGHIPSRTAADARLRLRHFESKLEQNVLYLLLSRADVVDVWDQPPPISYADSHGKRRTHVFDYLATLTDGRRIAIAVKPFAVAERRNFRETLNLIRAATPLTYAHEVVLVTERSYTPAAARNAQKLHEFRRAADLEADDIVARLIANLNGPTTIAELVAQSGLEGRAFRAVFRAIFAGFLRALDQGDILPSTTIAPEVM
ncbi:TnsA endonuclease N-terminal domain-containing protein [Paracoccus salipaludis]|uniref:Uncharacterized protein n=1 Tax=Paracoccus salipaludis TaxID=2032623 RepID=A0A2A2GP79_9RHOB|nr:TnsA endonuclease N-terminal domain-containing protein [Paracoccus salipaludis]PAU98837.1 hypothetical protein CK240_01500 [Paracoccus salipaludis]